MERPNVDLQEYKKLYRLEVILLLNSQSYIVKKMSMNTLW